MPMSSGGRWGLFTKRTEDPKLSWLEGKLSEAGISHRRAGESAHAPILEVAPEHLEAAWTILDPIDDIADDNEMFQGGAVPASGPRRRALLKVEAAVKAFRTRLTRDLRRSSNPLRRRVKKKVVGGKRRKAKSGTAGLIKAAKALKNIWR